jgi:hypothetical protein
MADCLAVLAAVNNGMVTRTQLRIILSNASEADSAQQIALLLQNCDRTQLTPSSLIIIYIAWSTAPLRECTAAISRGV